MPPTTVITDWGLATWAGFTAGLVSFYTMLPKLVGALVILLVAWALSAVLYALTDRVLDALRFDRLMAKTGVDQLIDRSGVHIDPSNVVALMVKWAVLLVGFMMAADALDLGQVSAGISGILGYIPNVIGAVVILTLGVLLAGFVRGAVRGAAETAGVRTADLLASLSFWAIAIFASLGAIAQLKIAPALVQTLYTAVVAAVALAASLAFGLGLREQARDVVAGRALGEQVHAGDDMVLEGEAEAGPIRGRVREIGTLKTLITTVEGTMSVPNHLLIDRVFRINRRLAPAGGGGGGAQEPATPPAKPPLKRQDDFPTI